MMKNVTNRREFFRLQATVPFSFKVIESRSARVSGDQVFTYQTRDLSGGGIRFETNLSLAVGDLLQLNVMVPDVPVRVQAKVAWVERAIVDGEDALRGGLEFVDIDEEIQDRLVGYLFRTQVEERRRRQGKVPSIEA